MALQKLTVEFQKDSLALRETSNLIGFIQCGLIAAGLCLMYHFNRIRDRAQARVDADAQRRHEEAQRRHEEAERRHEESERAAQQYREEAERAAQQYREEAERAARQYREEAERRHEESMAALKALIERTAPREG